MVTPDQHNAEGSNQLSRTRYMNHAYLKGHLLALGSLTLLIFALLFALIFVALFVSGTLIKKRQKKLEDQFSDHDPQ